MTKPKDKNAATEPKNSAPKAEATAKAATPKAAAKPSEKPAAKAAPAKTAAPEAAAPKSEEDATEAPKVEAPATDATESEKTEKEAPEAKSENVSGGLGDLLGLLTGGEPVDLSQIFKVLSAPAEETKSESKGEDEETREEGFAEEILTRVLGMASHPVFGVGIKPEEPRVKEFSLEDFFASAPIFDFFPEAPFNDGCCAEDGPFDYSDEPLVIVERDEETRSMGHLVELKKLYDAGILTEEEYTGKKRDILRSIHP